MIFNCHDALKRNKQNILKTYINRCATRIQALFRGHCARQRFRAPNQALFIARNRIAALVKGWRIRRIFSTEEVKNRILQVKEFERELTKKDLTRSLMVGLQMSRRNTIEKIKNLVQKMQVKGLWLTYRQLENCNKKRQQTKLTRQNLDPN